MIQLPLVHGVFLIAPLAALYINLCSERIKNPYEVRGMLLSPFKTFGVS